jgi:hypothetical protein
LVPVIVTLVPTLPEVGDKFVMLGVGSTVKPTPTLLPPPVVTTIGPDVALGGTGVTMLVALQLVGFAEVPLKATVLVAWVPPKFVPVMVMLAPAGPLLGETLVTFGVGRIVKLKALLLRPSTYTTRLPEVAP